MSLTDEQIVDELFKKNEVWRHADEDKPLDVYPRPMVHMLDAVFRERIDRRQELKRWKAIALYLADCHAANAECPPKSLSKHNRKRYKGILEKAITYLKGAWPPWTTTSRTDDVNHVIERCERAIEDLGV